MKHTNPAACLSCSLLRHVRDERPTPHQFLAWLGPSEASKYHVLRKAGLLREQDGRIVLSPEHLTQDGRRFRFESQLFLLDEERVLVFRGESSDVGDL